MMAGSENQYDFDRFLRYDEMKTWLTQLEKENPTFVALESIGKSYLGREIILATVTDTSTGAHDTKPAHWIDANIHSTEVTGGVAALYILYYLVQQYRDGDDDAVREALRTRTFYVVPRVNPDGVEAALADSPSFHRSSLRPWPHADAHRWPGLHMRDMDGDGCVRTMRIEDPDGGWAEHPDDPRVMEPVGPLGAPGRRRFLLLAEGEVEAFDGFTVPAPRDPLGLDLNRNFPAGWGPDVTGAGDHPLSEPEAAAVVRAVAARRNVCGYNALHTHGGFVLRPSSTRPDSALPPQDRWVYQRLGAELGNLTGLPTYSVHDDYTFDRASPLSGAADDWAYDHLGVYAWTTELWDAVRAATGAAVPLDAAAGGPTPAQELAVCRWADTHAPGAYAPWRPLDHPQLGRVEVGGADRFRVWQNAPAGPTLRAEAAAGHAEAAVYQALASPRIVIRLADAAPVGAGLWRVRVGVANAGWLPTDVSARARAAGLARPLCVELRGAVPADGAPARARLGQLAGRADLRGGGASGRSGTPERALHSWTVRGAPGDRVTVSAWHERAGRAEAEIVLRE
jgi:hypothetical protein